MLWNWTKISFLLINLEQVNWRKEVTIQETQGEQIRMLDFAQTSADLLCLHLLAKLFQIKRQSDVIGRKKCPEDGAAWSLMDPARAGRS